MADPQARSPWGIGGASDAGASSPWGQTSPSQLRIDDEALKSTPEHAPQDLRQQKFDFRGAIRANQRRTIFLVCGLISCVVAIGLLLGAAAWFMYPGVATLPQCLLGGALVLSVLVGASLAWQMRGATEHALEGQGAFHVTGKETGDLGVLARRLHNVTLEMALAASLPMPKVYLIDDPGLNAFAIGWRPETAAVAATRGLVETLQREELQAVMAHELAHIGQRDTTLMTSVMVIGSAILAILAILKEAMFHVSVRTSNGSARTESETTSRHSFLVRFIFVAIALVLAYLIATVAIPLIQMAISRQREFRADAYAAKFTRNPTSLCAALLQVEKRAALASASPAAAHLYIASPLAGSTSLWRAWMATHPPIQRRVARLRNLKDD